MKPLDKLTELLCENERVNEDLNKKPLQERQLRMYCEDKNIYIKIDVDWMICEWQNLEPVNIITTLDNTKDLYEQSDSVIERILDFLIESKQWK